MTCNISVHSIIFRYVNLTRKIEICINHSNKIQCKSWESFHRGLNKSHLKNTLHLRSRLRVSEFQSSDGEEDFGCSDDDQLGEHPGDRDCVRPDLKLREKIRKLEKWRHEAYEHYQIISRCFVVNIQRENGSHLRLKLKKCISEYKCKWIPEYRYD